MHRLQGKEQVCAPLQLLHNAVHLVKRCAAALRGGNLFQQQHRLRPRRERIHDADAAGGVALLAALLCHARGAVAAGEAACDRKGENIPALAEGFFPVGNIRASAVGAPLGRAERRDHRVDIEPGVIAKFLRLSAKGERNADKINPIQ